LILASAKRIVVKVGSSLLVEAGRANAAWLADLCADIARMRARGQQVLVVSSGAVALGRGRLSLPKRALTVPEKQAAAAAGQSGLMRAWEEAFEPHAIACAQVLLTRDDTEVRHRWLNARATVDTLLDLGVVPVVNENDTVVTEEIRYGDNDRLAARIAQLIGADALVLLSDVDGLYTADPRNNPSAEHLPHIARLTPQIEPWPEAPTRPPARARAGMATKLAAARIASAAGCATLITLGDQALAAPRHRGRRPGHRDRALDHAGCRLQGLGSPARWRLAAPGGGRRAAAAMRKGKSLLAAGIRRVDGRFGKGDAVLIRDESGIEVGRGLSRYDAEDAARICGLKSEAIEAELGYSSGPVVHADDLALAHHAAEA
jgi:glutamate 5-kinase